MVYYRIAIRTVGLSVKHEVDSQLLLYDILKFLSVIAYVDIL